MMNDGYGREVPPRHPHQQHRAVTKYLIVIDSAEGRVARLLAADRSRVADFDAATEEVVELTKTAAATDGASAPEWDVALAGHSAAERAAATVYTLDM
jgi:hypothetical protein